ncbi:hypothetical protein JZ751_002278, partial [Albula glossodonta]
MFVVTCLSEEGMSRPETVGPNVWAFSLGQRSLLGFGAVLAWMVLFHLLVNVWLLCMFTSLLVVLGGWLGSQAVLDSDSVVHLERFVTLEQVHDSPDSELQLEQEIRRTVHKITRDFVSSWYRTVSTEPEFEKETHDAMLAMGLELKRRARKMERRALTQRLLDLCGGHLQTYLQVQEMAEPAGREGFLSVEHDLWDLYCRVTEPHPALRSSVAEVKYARAIVDLLLHVLVPPPHLETRTGRFVVGELITCNVLLPLLSKMSDPDWLNLLIVDIFTKSSHRASETAEETVGWDIPQPSVEHQEPVSPRVQADVPSSTDISMPISTHDPSANDVIDATEQYGLQNSEEEEPRQEGGVSQFPAGKCAVNPTDILKPNKFNPFYQETDSDLDSPSSDFKKSSLESLVLIGPEETLSDRLRECTTPTDVSSVGDLEDEPQGDVALVEVPCPQVLVSEGLELSDSLGKGPEVEGERGERTGSCNPNELSVTGPLQTSSPAAGAVSLSTFSFEPLSSPEGPVIIQNLRITGTITAKEHRGTGSHPYTLYTIKIVVNAIVDTLKTAFPRSEPQSPTEEVDGDSEGKPHFDTKKSKSRLRFSSKITPVLSISDIQPKVLYCFNEGSTVFKGLSLSGLEAFIKEQERLASRTAAREAHGEESPLEVKGFTANIESLQGTQNNGAVAETALADLVLNILCLLMRQQWSWLCTDNILKSIRLLFGTLIDRYERTHPSAYRK